MRQAIVVIHGIGEQRPMSTLRSFVEAVIPPDGDDSGYYSKPHEMSELFELRRLQSKGSPKTDFFEYYWAYNVEGTKISSVLLWVGELVRKPARDIPSGLRTLWIISRLLLVFFVVLTAMGVLASISSGGFGPTQYSLLWFALAGITAFIQYLLVSYLGDAARYLSPAPGNIKLRQKIRSEGLQLIRKLHDSERYDRIVVVGHSLGSVIAYDILSRYWIECNKIYYFNNKKPLNTDVNSIDKSKGAAVNNFVRDCMMNGENPQNIIRNKITPTGESLSKVNDLAIDQFQELQKKAWIEQRMLGNPWRITDLVTLGSPLAHGMALMATNINDFARRKEQRELPTCPPIRASKTRYAFNPHASVSVGQDVNGKEKKFTPLILHHGAPFAVTRWTNIYIPAKHGLFGDFIGGSVAPSFGYGIREIPAHTRGKIANNSPLAHICYWRADTNIEADEDGTRTTEPVLDAVRAAISIRELRSFKPPDPPERILG